MSDYVDTRNTKLNEKYQTKVYYKTLDHNYTLTKDYRSSDSPFYENEKRSFSTDIYPFGKMGENFRLFDRFRNRNETKVKGIKKYYHNFAERFSISIPATKSKNPDETYDSIFDIIGDEAKVYRLNKSIIIADKSRSKTYVGNSNKRYSYQRHENSYHESKSEKNAIVHTSNLICANGEVVIEERFKPLNDRAGGRRGALSRKFTGKKVDDFEKGKYTYRRTRV